MDSDNTSLRSSKKEDAPEKKVGFARPTLVIPNQTHQRPTTLDIPSEESAPPGDKSDPYGIRKQSVFIFDQINGLRDFTVSSAKTGLGFGEKSAYWLYNKVRVLSRKWFTHCFLSIVLIIYTIGGAVSFQTLEDNIPKKPASPSVGNGTASSPSQPSRSALAPWTATIPPPDPPGRRRKDRRKKGRLREADVSDPHAATETHHSRYTGRSRRYPADRHEDYFGKRQYMYVFDQINDLKDFTVNTARSGLGVGEKCAYWLYNKIKDLSRKWFTHCFLSIILMIYTMGGALAFQKLEGPYEDEKEPLDMRTLTYELIEELTVLSEVMPFENQTDQWKITADEKVKGYILKVIENRQIENFIKANRGPKVWTLINSVVFCATIYTTIGYGHMYPKTHTGRALTIVYALIGIPLFLIALTDFGKLFTRCIKFLWSFVRRLYYTGSCRKVRKNAGVDDIFKGAQMMYDVATFRRPSAFQSSEADPENQNPPTDTPTTPAISNFEIDDEFNLPISVALFILVAYIFCGACIYMVIENWGFFEAFYFVFISMSTIGFGDYVPRDPVFMIISIIYLVFGLALMSMCINVVQAKLSDTFKQASAKIGATIGLEVDENGSVITTPENNEAPPIPETTPVKENVTPKEA